MNFDSSAWKITHHSSANKQKFSIDSPFVEIYGTDIIIVVITHKKILDNCYILKKFINLKLLLNINLLNISSSNSNSSN